MANTYELIVKTVDQSTRPLKNIERSLASLERRSRTVNTAIKGVGAALAVIVTARALGSVIDVTSRFEDLRTTLASVTGSVREGGRAFDFITEFATRSQFGVEDLSEAFIKLQAAGITPTERLFRVFTDTAAVTTDQLGSLQAITDLISRTTGGGLGLEELNRLADRGIPVFNILNQELGVTRQEVSELGRTAEGANRIVNALLTGLDRQFGGATEARLQNLSTIVSNFQIATRQAIGEFGAGLSPALKEVITSLTNFINANQNVFRALGQGTGEVLRLFATGIGNVAESLGLLQAGGLQNVFANLLDGFAAFLEAFDAGVKKLLSGIASIANGFNQVIISISNLPGAGFDAVFEEDVAGIIEQRTRLEQEIARMEEAVTGLQTRAETARGNQTLLERLGLAGDNSEYYQTLTDLATMQTSLNMARMEFDRLGDQIGEDTVILQRFNTDLGTTNTATAEAAENIRNTAAALRESAEAAALNEQFPVYEDAILRIARAQQALNDASNGFVPPPVGDPETTDQVNQLTTSVSGLTAFMQDLIGTATNTANELSYAMQAKQLLRQELDAGRISIDTFAYAMQSLNNILGESVTETQTAAQAYDALIQQVNATIAQEQLNEQVVRLVNQAYRDGVINVDQYKAAMQGLGITIAQTGSQLSGFQQFLQTTIQSAQANVAQTGYAIQAQGELDAQLAAGQISLDVYAEAMNRVNGILGTNTPAAAGAATEAIATVTSTYEDAIGAIDEFNLKQTNVAGAMGMLESDFANGKISLEEFRVGMNSMGADMDDIQNRSIAMGLTLTESFRSAGDSLARGLARGIARGEGIMNSFKNFMQSILEEILYQIIQQAFIKPLISSMTSGLSTAFSAFSMGGAGAFGGGLFGGAGGIFGLLGGFLGFANGGIVPGLPTRGDSVPILATPGEVILNKQQQAQVLQGGGEEPITVNFNISAIDTRSGTEFILQNKKQITSVIQQAYNTRGQTGPLG